MQRLRKGDDVVVISGADKGARGNVDSVIYNDAHQVTHVIIKGLNKRVKHTKPNPQKQETGGRIAIDMPLQACKVALYNEKKGGPDRVRIKVDGDGKRERVFASNGEKV